MAPKEVIEALRREWKAVGVEAMDAAIAMARDPTPVNIERAAELTELMASFRRVIERMERVPS
jgi:hypothetical protein